MISNKSKLDKINCNIADIRVEIYKRNVRTRAQNLIDKLDHACEEEKKLDKV